MNHVTRSLSSNDISIFSPEISKFCYMKKYRYRLHIDTSFVVLLTYFESLKISLMNMVAILMMSAKIATLGLLKITIFWNEGYDVIIYVHDVTNQILSRELYCRWAHVTGKFGNSSVYMRKVIITSILWEFDQKNHFFKGWFQ